MGNASSLTGYNRRCQGHGGGGRLERMRTVAHRLPRSTRAERAEWAEPEGRCGRHCIRQTGGAAKRHSCACKGYDSLRQTALPRRRGRHH